LRRRQIQGTLRGGSEPVVCLIKLLLERSRRCSVGGVEPLNHPVKRQVRAHQRNEHDEQHGVDHFLTLLRRRSCTFSAAAANSASTISASMRAALCSSNSSRRRLTSATSSTRNPAVLTMSSAQPGQIARTPS